ncbi:hypothetical protein CYMTET_21392 [Cymbomonas tetramitiformis]|uniref:Uncharacterized protein n=1 Tax=Cymbomonas tetramitiformis TaxID=36881 RepID=A0AAE0L3B8_9CHLO|nr:hypothetical protein CYMTET_21392 [Cymbomonas tetramitiformis]|eukprot:gene6882-8216_t
MFGKLATYTWLLALPVAVFAKCPGSASLVHAKCELTAEFQNSCADVHEEVLARMNGANGWADPHNGGSYSVISSTDTTVDGTRLTGNKKYTDKFELTFAESSNGCTVSGCSESQVFSVLDMSTNYCNQYNLFCNTAGGCTKVKHDLQYTITTGSCMSHDQSQCVVTAAEKVARWSRTQLIPFLGRSDESCPAVHTQDNFDLDSYVSGKWFIHQQQPTKYLPKEQNFCVYAEYTKMAKKSLLGFTVQVHNYAQEADGTPHDSGKNICAMPDSSKDPAKLNVGPCFLPPVSGVTTGPYWILAYNAEEGYALVSGGQPTIKTPDGCKTGSGVNGSGLWIFSRKQERDEDLLNKVRAIAKAQGFDLSVLNDVDQTNCGSSIVL